MRLTNPDVFGYAIIKRDNEDGTIDAQCNICRSHVKLQSSKVGRIENCPKCQRELFFYPVRSDPRFLGSSPWGY